MGSKPLAIVLAAGQGKRMASDLPKVLVEVCGRPMVFYVLNALRQAGIEAILVVVGYRRELVREALSAAGVTLVDQSEQLGTGHAVMSCRPWLEKLSGPVVIVAGDSPLTQSDSIRAILDLYDLHQPACILGTAEKEDPAGLGRIVRDAQGNFVAIVEEKDATPEQKRIREVNMSTYVFDARALTLALDRLTRSNRQSEYYLTDCPGILRRLGMDVRALPVLKPCEALSINTMEELRAAEAELAKWH